MRRVLVASLTFVLFGCSGLVCGGAKESTEVDVAGWTLAVECSWERNESGGGGGRGGMSTPAEGCHGGWSIRAQREAGQKKTITTQASIGDVSCVRAKVICGEKRGKFAMKEEPDGVRVAVDVGGAGATGIYIPAGCDPFPWRGPLPQNAEGALAAMPTYDDAVDQMIDGRVPWEEDMFWSLTPARARKHRAPLERAKKTCRGGEIMCNHIERVLASLDAPAP